MCLDKLTSEPDPEFRGTVYKVLNKDWVSPVMGYLSYAKGVTYTARMMQIPAIDIDTRREFNYLSGFHCFFNRKEAIEYMFGNDILVECEVQNLLAKGIDNKKDVGVFRYMTITRALGFKDPEGEYHGEPIEDSVPKV